VFFLYSEYGYGAVEASSEGFWLFFLGRTNRALSPARFSSLGDWVWPRMFFLGSEQMEINATGLFFKIFLFVSTMVQTMY
jgi:hypothetical protein